jgi:hypothetical protein
MAGSRGLGGSSKNSHWPSYRPQSGYADLAACVAFSRRVSSATAAETSSAFCAGSLPAPAASRAFFSAASSALASGEPLAGLYCHDAFRSAWAACGPGSVTSSIVRNPTRRRTAVQASPTA